MTRYKRRKKLTNRWTLVGGIQNHYHFRGVVSIRNINFACVEKWMEIEQLWC